MLSDHLNRSDQRRRFIGSPRRGHLLVDPILDGANPFDVYNPEVFFHEAFGEVGADVSPP
jgi:hypothetical protein